MTQKTFLITRDSPFLEWDDAPDLRRRFAGFSSTSYKVVPKFGNMSGVVS